MSTVKAPEPNRIQVKPVAGDLFVCLFVCLFNESSYEIISFIHSSIQQVFITRPLVRHCRGCWGLGVNKNGTKMDRALVLVGPLRRAFSE